MMFCVFEKTGAMFIMELDPEIFPLLFMCLIHIYVPNNRVKRNFEEVSSQMDGPIAELHEDDHSG